MLGKRWFNLLFLSLLFLLTIFPSQTFPFQLENYAEKSYEKNSKIDQLYTVEIRDVGYADNNTTIYIYDEKNNLKIIKHLPSKWNISFHLNTTLPTLLFKDYKVGGKDVSFIWGDKKPIFITNNPIELYLYKIIEEILNKLNVTKTELLNISYEVKATKERGNKNSKEIEKLKETVNNELNTIKENLSDIPHSFLELNDTPDYYKNGMLLIVKHGKITYISPSKVGSSNKYSFLDLTDTPSSYTGQGGKVIAVKPTEDGLTFTTITTTDEKVKADPTDPTAGYLSNKVDGTTIKVDTTTHKMYVDETAINHNNLNNLQGGGFGQYYHLTQTQYNTLTTNMPFADGYVLYSNGGNIDTSIIYYDKNTNKVGIGTSTPTNKLHIIGSAKATQGFTANSGSANQPPFRFYNDGNTGMFNPSNDNLAFSTAGQERLRIDNQGFVGIGTTNPQSKLHIENGELWLFYNNNNPRFVIGDSPITGQYGWLQWDSANDYFRIDSSDSPSLGGKIKGNTLVIGNVYPRQTAVFIAANNTKEILVVEKNNTVLIGNKSYAGDTKLNIYGEDKTYALRVEENTTIPLLLFGLNHTKVINITINSPTTIENVTINLTIPYYSGMRSDFGDLSFSLYDASTGKEIALSHWVESYTPSTSANVWVFVPYVNSNTYLHLYYGANNFNHGNKESVFLYYNDFESYKDLRSTLTNFAVRDSKLIMWGNYGGCCGGSCFYSGIGIDKEFTLPITVEIKFRQVPHSPVTTCGRTGPAIVFDNSMQAVVSTSTTNQGISTRIGGFFSLSHVGFPSGWRTLSVSFTNNGIEVYPDWTTPKIMVGTPPQTKGRLIIAGDTDSNVIYDEIDWIRVYRPFTGPISFSPPQNVKEITTTTFVITKGRIGINTEQPQANLDVNGTVKINPIKGGGLNLMVDEKGYIKAEVSSSKYKTNIENLSIDSSSIYNLTPKQFRWKDGTTGYGLIAEEVEKQLPEMVIYKDGKPYGVNYRLLQMLMLNEIKNLKEELEKLKQENRELKQQLEELSNKTSNPK